MWTGVLASVDLGGSSLMGMQRVERDTGYWGSRDMEIKAVG